MEEEEESEEDKKLTKHQRLFKILTTNVPNLAKNWNFNLSTLLQDYLTELELALSKNGDSALVDFVEISLVLQGATNIYVKKVQYLCRQVYDFRLHLFKLNRDQDEAKRRDDELLLLEQRRRERRRAPEGYNSDDESRAELQYINEENVPALAVPPKRTRRTQQAPPPEDVPVIPKSIVEEYSSAKSLSDLLNKLFKRINGRTQDYIEQLPLFQEVETDVKRRCCIQLAKCIVPGEPIISSFIRFLIADDDSEEVSLTSTISKMTEYYGKRIMVCKMMLLVEIQKRVLISDMTNAAAKIRAYLQKFISEHSPQNAAKCHTPTNFYEDHFTSSNVNAESTPFSQSNQSARRVPIVLLTSLTPEQISRYIDKSPIPDVIAPIPGIMEEVDNEDTIDSFAEFISCPDLNMGVLPPMIINGVQFHNKFQIPKRLLRKRKLFQLPTEIIEKEKVMRCVVRSTCKFMHKLKRKNLGIPVPAKIVVRDETEFLGTSLNSENIEFAVTGDVEVRLPDDRIVSSVARAVYQEELLTQDSGIGSQTRVLGTRELTLEVDGDRLDASQYSGIGTQDSGVVSDLGLTVGGDSDRLTSINQPLSPWSVMNDGGVTPILDSAPTFAGYESNDELLSSSSTAKNSGKVDITTEAGFIKQIAENLKTQKKMEIEMNQMRLKVTQWHEFIRQKTELQIDTPCDLHEYGTKILDTFSEEQKINKTPISFQSIVQGTPRKDIAKYFLATLQLANDNNVELTHSNGEEMDSLVLVKQSSVRQHNTTYEQLGALMTEEQENQRRALFSTIDENESRASYEARRAEFLKTRKVTVLVPPSRVSQARLQAELEMGLTPSLFSYRNLEPSVISQQAKTSNGFLNRPSMNSNDWEPVPSTSRQRTSLFMRKSQSTSKNRDSRFSSSLFDSDDSSSMDVDEPQPTASVAVTKLKYKYETNVPRVTLERCDLSGQSSGASLSSLGNANASTPSTPVGRMLPYQRGKAPMGTQQRLPHGFPKTTNRSSTMRPHILNFDIGKRK